MKKISIALVFTLLFSLISLVSCGNPFEPSSPPTNPPAPVGDGELDFILVSDGSCYVVGGMGTCTLTEIVIPSEYKGLPVSEIAMYAFSNSNIVSIVIPDSVDTIRSSAFSGCTSLKSVTLPTTLTTIEQHTFANCASLSAITIPESVKLIEGDAFNGCTSLSDITVNNSLLNEFVLEFEGTPYFETIKALENGAYYAANTLLSYDPDSPPVHLTLREGTLRIADNAFRDCTTLESLQTNEGLLYIGNNAFWGCTSLSSISLVDSIQRIGESAFSNTLYCSGESWQAAEREGACYIGNYLIELTGAYFPNDFDYRTSITIREGTVGIADCAGRGFSASVFGTVYIPASVKYIGYDVFSTMSGLSSIVVDEANENYQSIDGVLYNKDATTLLAYPAEKSDVCIIPDTVTRIEDYAFMNAKSVQIVLPTSVKAMGDSAFCDIDHIALFYQGTYDEYNCIETVKDSTWFKTDIFDGIYMQDDWHYEDGIPVPND